MRILASLLVFCALGLAACRVESGAASVQQSQGLQNLPVLEALAEEGAQKLGFSFVALGDCRDGWEIYKRNLDLAVSLDPDFIVVVGDFVPTGAAQEFDDYAAVVNDVAVPLVHVPGNHEVIAGRESFPRYVGDWNFAFEYGGFSFVSLDNSSGVFEAETVTFLEDSLAARKPAIVFFHAPLAYEEWAVHSVKTDAKGGRGGEVLEVLKSFPVRLVVNGHIHLHDEKSINGIPFVISGGAGSPLHKQYSFGDAEYGFLIVRVVAGMVDYEWVPLPDQA